MADLLQSLDNLTSGRTSDPSQDKLYANDPRYMQSLDPAVKGEVTPIPLGDIADPVSQLAMLVAPILKGFVGRQGSSNLSSNILQSQRGSTGSGQGESFEDAFKRMFLSRGGKEDIPAKARIQYEDFLKGISGKQGAADIPVIMPQQPRTTIEKAASVLNDWNSISPTDFAQQFREQHGSIDPKTVQKLWDYFVNEGIIHPEAGKTLSGYGMHKVDSNAIRDLLPNLKLR